MQIWNLVTHEEIVERLNVPEPDMVDYGHRIEHYAKSAGDVSREEGDSLWRAEISRWLRVYVDEWLKTGVDSDGTEYPFQRNPFHTDDAKWALLEYLDRHQPKVTLSPDHGLDMTFGEPPEVTGDWNDLFVAAKTEAQRFFTAFIMSDGTERLCKCRHCGCYFLGKPRRRRYKYGTFCSRVHSQRAGAIKCTDERRRRVESKLIRYAAERLRSRRVDSPSWQQDRRLKGKLADDIREYLWGCGDSELKRYREGICLKVGWVTRHQQKIEQARLERAVERPRQRIR
jgi:hypothetical protein